MLSIDIDEDVKKIYVGISGNITVSEAEDFFSGYRNFIKTIRPDAYRLILEVSEFQIEDQKYMRNAMMMFLQSGFRKIYIVDSEQFVVRNLRLSRMEKRVFYNNVTVVTSISQVP